MLHQPSIQKLHDMRLSAMAEAFKEQLNSQTYDTLTFEERLAIFIDHEWSRRKTITCNVCSRKQR
jgi:hypothetical protein